MSVHKNYQLCVTTICVFALLTGIKLPHTHTHIRGESYKAYRMIVSFGTRDIDEIYNQVQFVQAWLVFADTYITMA